MIITEMLKLDIYNCIV